MGVRLPSAQHHGYYCIVVDDIPMTIILVIPMYLVSLVVVLCKQKSLRLEMTRPSQITPPALSNDQIMSKSSVDLNHIMEENSVMNHILL